MAVYIDSLESPDITELTKQLPKRNQLLIHKCQAGLPINVKASRYFAVWGTQSNNFKRLLFQVDTGP